MFSVRNASVWESEDLVAIVQSTWVETEIVHTEFNMQPGWCIHVIVGLCSTRMRPCIQILSTDQGDSTCCRWAEEDEEPEAEADMADELGAAARMRRMGQGFPYPLGARWPL